MTLFEKKLRYGAEGTVYAIDLYTDIADVPDGNFVELQYDGKALYAPSKDVGVLLTRILASNLRSAL